MHNLVLLLAVLLLALPQAKAQNQGNKLLVEEYLQQSEKQKKAGTIMIAAGGAAAVIGLLLASTASDWDSPALGGGGILFFAGSASALIGVPIIVSSASKARKAAILSLEANSARMIDSNGSSLQVYPALNLSIPLNSPNR